MTADSDLELLRRFVAGSSQGSSQQAFSELVRRHIDWVSAAARRRVAGDPHLADDVTQAVFILLAKKSKSLANRREAVLSAWLFAAMRYCSLEVLRTQRRQQARDRHAAQIMRQQQPHTSEESSSSWSE